MKIPKRKIPKRLPHAVSPAYAAQFLNCRPKTVIAACRRWDLGTQVTTINDRTFFVLTPDDVKTLSKRLKHGRGVHYPEGVDE